MASLRPALESYGIVLPEPDGRRLLSALDAPEGWSGGEGRYLHANGLVLSAAFHRHSDGTLVLTLPTPLLRLWAPQAFPEMLPDHPGVADPAAEAHPHKGWRIGFLRAPLRGVLPDGAAFGQALDAAAGPATRARLRALTRACARHFGGPGQWAAVEDPETGDVEESVILSPAAAHPPRETTLHALDLLQPLLESHDVRAFQRDGLHLIDRLAWEAPAGTAHQRLGDREILAPFLADPLCPRWLRDAAA